MPCWKLSLTWVSQISGGLWPAQHFLLPGASQIWDFVDSLGTFYSLRHPKFRISLTRSALSTLWGIPNSKFRWLAQHFLLSGASQIRNFVDSLGTFYSLGHPKFEISLTCSALSTLWAIPNSGFCWLAQHFLLPGASQIQDFVDSLDTFYSLGHPKFEISLTCSMFSLFQGIPNLNFSYLVKYFLIPKSPWISIFVDLLSSFPFLSHPESRFRMTCSALSTSQSIPSLHFR